MRMKKHRIIIFILLAAAFIFTTAIIKAQDVDAPAGSTDLNVIDGSRDVITDDAAVNEPDTGRKVEEKSIEVVKPAVKTKKEGNKTAGAVEVKKTVIATKDQEPAGATGLNISESLLPVQEGDFKYVRIPDIGITMKRGAAVEDVIVKMPEETPGSSADDGVAQKGLFGFSGKTTDTVVRVALVLLILFIFILYRMRSKGSSRSVMRNFPKNRL